MTKHIRILTPHTTPRPAKLDEVVHLSAMADLKFSHVGIDSGPPSIEREFDEVLCAPYVVGRCIEAETQGVDAVIIDCMADPGLAAAREAVSIPVLGPGETCMLVAAMLGRRYGFITVFDRIRPIIEGRARVYGTYDRLACVRSIDVRLLNIDENESKLVDALITQAIGAILEDKADVIILGCTGFLGVSDKIEAGLRDRGIRAPVTNPLRATAMLAFALLSVGLTHSSVAYPWPGGKAVKGYDDLPHPASTGKAT